jgi:hypothetical protein
MKYNSLGQYFYKLYTLIFILMLMPMGVFIFLYQRVRLGFQQPIEFDINEEYVLYGVIGVSLLDWLMASILFHYRLRFVLKTKSLGERLSQYATLTIVRNAAVSFGMLMLAIGYYLTEEKWLTVIFLASLILPVLYWPSPKQVCRNLQLKGDEYKMVLYRMDYFT